MRYLAMITFPGLPEFSGFLCTALSHQADVTALHLFTYLVNEAVLAIWYETNSNAIPSNQ